MFHIKYFSYFPSITSLVKMILFCQFLSYKSGIRTNTSYWRPLLSYPIIAVGRKAVVVAQSRSDYYRITTIISKYILLFWVLYNFSPKPFEPKRLPPHSLSPNKFNSTCFKFLHTPIIDVVSDVLCSIFVFVLVVEWCEMMWTK